MFSRLRQVFLQRLAPWLRNHDRHQDRARRDRSPGQPPVPMPGEETGPTIGSFQKDGFLLLPPTCFCGDWRGLRLFLRRQLRQSRELDYVTATRRTPGQMRFISRASCYAQCAFKISAGCARVEAGAHRDGRAAPRQMTPQHNLKFQCCVVRFECHCCI